MNAVTSCAERGGFIKQEALEHGSVMEQEAASCLLGNLVCRRCAVQDDLGKDAVRSATNPASEVCTNLTGDQISVRPLGSEDQMDAKGSALPCNDGQFAFKQSNLVFPLFVSAGFVQNLRNLITGEHKPFQLRFRDLVVLANSFERFLP